VQKGSEILADGFVQQRILGFAGFVLETGYSGVFTSEDYRLGLFYDARFERQRGTKMRSVVLNNVA
jgi:hypothetical protein